MLNWDSDVYLEHVLLLLFLNPPLYEFFSNKLCKSAIILHTRYCSIAKIAAVLSIVLHLSGNIEILPNPTLEKNCDFTINRKCSLEHHILQLQLTALVSLLLLLSSLLFEKLWIFPYICLLTFLVTINELSHKHHFKKKKRYFCRCCTH